MYANGRAPAKSTQVREFRGCPSRCPPWVIRRQSRPFRLCRLQTADLTAGIAEIGAGSKSDVTRSPRRRDRTCKVIQERPGLLREVAVMGGRQPDSFSNLLHEGDAVLRIEIV